MSHGPSSRPDEAFIPNSDGERRRLATLRENWGKPVERERDPATVALLHRWNAQERKTVDDQTWGDLDLDEVFAKVDHTLTMPGRQVLYRQLRTYADSATLAERARQQALFRCERSARERLQLLLTELDRPGAAYVAPLLLGSLPPRPDKAGLYFALSLLTPACVVGMFFFHPLILVALTLILINAVIYLTYGQEIMPHFTGFAQINTLLTTAEKLGHADNPHRLPPLTTLHESLPLIQQLRKRLGPLVADRAAMPDLIQSLFGYLNMLFLFDVVVFLRSLRVLREAQATLVAIFDAIGTVDAAIAVASYLDGLPGRTVVPELVEAREFDVAGLYHPLIPEPVANPLALDRRSALIAGPNMVGKTAFIRTVGINLILAQTLHFCLAERARLPRAVVRSAIRREDRLTDGSSYFFAEIKQVLEFARTGADAPLHVFLIDEIFRGTNTTERLASSAAVLRHLAQHHIVFATTHDAELQEMLADVCTMFHFTDRVDGDGYGFDYRIRPGPVRSRNAIRLLELSGYPATITQEAERLAASIEARQPHAGSWPAMRAPAFPTLASAAPAAGENGSSEIMPHGPRMSQGRAPTG